MEGEGVTLIADHAVNSFCNMLHRVFLYCLRVITSYPLSRVFHHYSSSGEEEEDVTVDFGMFSKYTLRFVYEQ